MILLNYRQEKTLNSVMIANIFLNLQFYSLQIFKQNIENWKSQIFK